MSSLIHGRKRRGRRSSAELDLSQDPRKGRSRQTYPFRGKRCRATCGRSRKGHKRASRFVCPLIPLRHVLELSASVALFSSGQRPRRTKYKSRRGALRTPQNKTAASSIATRLSIPRPAASRLARTPCRSPRARTPLRYCPPGQFDYTGLVASRL